MTQAALLSVVVTVDELVRAATQLFWLERFGLKTLRVSPSRETQEFPFNPAGSIPAPATNH